MGLSHSRDALPHAMLRLYQRCVIRAEPHRAFHEDDGPDYTRHYGTDQVESEYSSSANEASQKKKPPKKFKIAKKKDNLEKTSTIEEHAWDKLLAQMPQSPSDFRIAGGR